MGTQPSEDSTAQRGMSGPEWKAALLVGATLGVTQLGYYLTASALPLYLRDLGAAQSRIGFEVGFGNIAGVIITLLLGPALNRYGSRLFLRISAVLYLLAAAGMLAFQVELPVAAFRTVQGVGGALIVPASMTLAARLVPHRPGTAMGAMGAMNALSLAAGPPVGLILYARYGAAGLFIPALAAAMIGFAIVFLLPNIPAPEIVARGFGFDRAWAPLISPTDSLPSTSALSSRTCRSTFERCTGQMPESFSRRTRSACFCSAYQPACWRIDGGRSCPRFSAWQSRYPVLGCSRYHHR